MTRFSILDPKYDGLEPMEKIRQVDRDNMLYELGNTKACNITSTSYSDSKVNNTAVIWFIVFVLGGLVSLIYYIADKDYNLGFGNLPYYIYIGILVAIIIVGTIKSIMGSLATQTKKLRIEKEKPDIEKEIRKLQRKHDSIGIDIKINEAKVKSLENKLAIESYSNVENVDNIGNEIKKIKLRIADYEDKQIELEEQIEELESKIY